jgi:hypothetical protein
MDSYKVTRKHPNKDAGFDLSCGSKRYKDGDVIGLKAIQAEMPSPEIAASWIKTNLDRKWIKENKPEKKATTTKKEVKKDVNKM